MTLEAGMLDRRGYCYDMHRSMPDKLFFTGIVNAGLLVDYGCADGALLRSYRRMFPKTSLLGYDKSVKMLQDAKERSPKDMVFTENWDDVEALTENADGPKVLIMSSVFHEMKSYMDEVDFLDAWCSIWGADFDYVVIRDMMVSRNSLTTSDPLHVAKVRHSGVSRKIEEWEERWGSLDGKASLIHFLLTYKYTSNWERELNENYLPTTVEHFLQELPTQTHRMVHFEHYTLPYTRQQVRQDFDVDLTDRTHIKLIMERN